MKSTKTGFNLIEIAIVLAVIGLVIGGIYVAASAVTENNRRQTNQKQLLQIVQNVRSIFATQPSFSTLTHDQIKAVGIMPADVIDDGSYYFNVYGGTISLVDSPTAYGRAAFLIQFLLPTGACIDLLTKFFGSAANNQAMGVLDVGTSHHASTGVYTGIGSSIGAATTTCQEPGLGNIVDMYFSLR